MDDFDIVEPVFQRIFARLVTVPDLPAAVDALPAAERAIVATRILEGEVDNGGWYQLFGNGNAGMIEPSISGYEKLGLPDLCSRPARGPFEGFQRRVPRRSAQRTRCSVLCSVGIRGREGSARQVGGTGPLSALLLARAARLIGVAMASGLWFALVATALLAACASTDMPTPAPHTARTPAGNGTSEATNATPVSPAPTGVDWTTLARPLHVARIAPDSPCPKSSARTVSKAYAPALGDGPVYPVGFIDGVLSVVPRYGQHLAKVLWVSAAAYQGPVLLRGVRLDGPGVVQFADGNSEPADEFRLMEPGAFSPDEEPGWREWPSYTVVPQFGCYAYQVDGTSFSTVVVFEARAGA